MFEGFDFRLVERVIGRHLEIVASAADGLDEEAVIEFSGDETGP